MFDKIHIHGHRLKIYFVLYTKNLTEDFVNIHRLPTAEECATNQYAKTAEQPQVRVFC